MWFGAAVLLAVAVYAFRRPVLAAMGRALVENDALQKADCVLVLGGDEFGSRILTAGQLVREGYAPYAWVDGPVLLVGHASDSTIQYAEQQGFPQSFFRPLELPKEVDSTASEAKYVGSTLRRSGVKAILLVTSNYHTRRAARFMRAANPWLKVTVVAAPDPFFSADGWWKNRNGKKTFLLETTKTITEMGGV